MLGSLKKILFKILPDSWLLFSGPISHKAIYLTFDDGPHGEYTRQLLGILKEHEVKVSFFVTGDHVTKDMECLMAIASEGHDIFNHSYQHWEFEKFNSSKQLSDLNRLDELIKDLSGFSVVPFRPPRGKLTITLLARLILGKRQTIYWSYDSLDYKQKGEQQILQQFKNRSVRPGDILLFHDDNPYTISALPKLLTLWKNSGFSIEPVSKLIK